MKNSMIPTRLLGLLGVCVLAVALALAGACTGEPEEDPGWGNQQDGGEDDAGDQDVEDDAGDEDAGDEIDTCDEIDCDDGEVCVDGECYDEDLIGYSCVLPRQLGTLSPGETISELADPRGHENTVTTVCPADDQSPAAVFAFDVEETMDVDIDVELTNDELTHSIVYQLRSGSCTSQPGSDYCGFEGTLEAGEYFLIVEGRRSGQIAQFELTIDSEAVGCEPAGATYCDGDDLALCDGGDEEIHFGCVDGCIDDECVGDSCAHTLEVTSSGNYTVDLGAYSNNFNFSSDAAGCSSSGDGISTSGQDLVFSLPGLSSGDVVTVDRPDTSWAIGVMEDCSDSNPVCIHGHSSSSDFEWEVDDPGDYFLVVNRYSSGSGEVDFQIDIQ